MLVPATARKPPPCGFIVRLSRFVSVAEPTLPGLRLASDHLHHGEGTFLSVVHCQQPSCSLAPKGAGASHEPLGCLNRSLEQQTHVETMMRSTLPARIVDKVEALKREAGIAACSFVSSGMTLGLGTGSTVRYTVLEIGRRMAEEGLQVKGVPTSEATRYLAEGLGIPLLTLKQAGGIDLTIDGADEFDPDFQLIKGGGGALTREKRVAAASKAMVVVADDRKQVPVLGRFDLPLEVDTGDWERVRDELDSICPGSVSLRGGQSSYVTDNGGYILDCEFGPTIANPGQLEELILSVDGVVEVGLFVGMCDAVVMATPSEVLTLVKQGGRLD